MDHSVYIAVSSSFTYPYVDSKTDYILPFTYDLRMQV